MVSLAALNLPFRGIQMLLALLNLGLSGYMVSYGYGKYCTESYSYYGDFYYPATCAKYSIGEYGYALFTSIWTVLAVGFLIPASMGKLPEKLPIAIITSVVDGLTMLFWFSSWIAVAVFRGMFDLCDSSAPCATAAAFAAFGAVEWALFVATFTFGIIALRKSRMENTAAPAPTPAPGTAPGPTPVV